MSFNLLKSSVFATAIFLCVGLSSAYAGPGYDYQLYKNPEKFGIVVFPKDFIFSELDGYITSLSFEPAESGTAVMRYGSKNENSTYMMPLEIQKKHSKIWPRPDWLPNASLVAIMIASAHALSFPSMITRVGWWLLVGASLAVANPST